MYTHTTSRNQQSFENFGNQKVFRKLKKLRLIKLETKWELSLWYHQVSIIYMNSSYKSIFTSYSDITTRPHQFKKDEALKHTQRYPCICSLFYLNKFLHIILEHL